MFEVITFSTAGDRIDTGECDTQEQAVTAGRALWDDRIDAHLDVAQVGFYVDGKLVRMLDRRP